MTEKQIRMKEDALWLGKRKKKPKAKHVKGIPLPPSGTFRLY